MAVIGAIAQHIECEACDGSGEQTIDVPTLTGEHGEETRRCWVCDGDGHVTREDIEFDLTDEVEAPVVIAPEPCWSPYAGVTS